MQTVPNTRAQSNEVRFFSRSGGSGWCQTGSGFFFFLLIRCLFSHNACCLHQPTQCELQEAESAVCTRTFKVKKEKKKVQLQCVQFFSTSFKEVFLFQANVKVEKTVSDLCILCLYKQQPSPPHSAHITEVNLLLLVPLRPFGSR